MNRRGSDQHQLFAERQFAVQVRMVDRARDERAFQPGVDDRLNQAAGGACANHRPDLGVSLGKLCNQLRQTQRQGGLQRTDLKHTVGLSIVARGAGCIQQQLRKPCGEGQQAASRGRDLDAPGAALKQRHTQLDFQ
ncbi:hypothetical protein D3C86_1556990 [compost metagenome]